MKWQYVVSPFLFAIACASPYGAEPAALDAPRSDTNTPRGGRPDAGTLDAVDSAPPTTDGAPDESPAGCAGHVCESFDESTTIDATWTVQSQGGGTAAIISSEQSVSPPHVLELAVPASSEGVRTNASMSRTIATSELEIALRLNLRLEGAFTGTPVDNYIAPVIVAGLERKVWVFAHAAGLSIQDCAADSSDCSDETPVEGLLPNGAWAKLTVGVSMSAGTVVVDVDGVSTTHPLKATSSGAVRVQLGIEGRTAEGSAPAATAWLDDVVIR